MAQRRFGSSGWGRVMTGALGSLDCDRAAVGGGSEGRASDPVPTGGADACGAGDDGVRVEGVIAGD